MKSPGKRIQGLALATLAALALSGCVGGTRSVTIPVTVNCAARIPPLLRAPVEHADAPADGTVGAWVKFGDAQTGRVDDANERKASVIWIVEACEAEEAKAAKALDDRTLIQRLFTRRPKPG